MSQEQNESTPVEAVKVEPVKLEAHLAPGRMGTGGGGSDTPQIGLGTTLAITPPTGSAPTTVKIQTIKLPTWAGKDVEVTGMNDTMDSYIPGVPNAGEAEIDILYMKTQSASLYALRNVAGTTFLVTFPDGGTRTFTGWINSFGEEVPLKEKISCKIKVRASSLVSMA